MTTVTEQTPRAPEDAPSWAVRMLQNIVAWVQNRDIGPQRLTAYPTALPPNANTFPRALIYDSTLNVPAFSNTSGVWVALSAAGGSGSFTTLAASGTVSGAGFTAFLTSGQASSFSTLSIGLGAITSGTYTPTLTNSANITSSTALLCQYMRVGSVVTVSGGVTLTPTLLATLTTLGVSLPVASNLANAENLGGAANSASVASASAAVFCDAANDRATMQMISVGTGAETFYFSFTYQVI